MSFKSQSCSSYSFKYSVNMCASVCVCDGNLGQVPHLCVRSKVHELPYTIGRTINWCSCYGEQYGGSFKK